MRRPDPKKRRVRKLSVRPGTSFREMVSHPLKKNSEKENERSPHSTHSLKPGEAGMVSIQAVLKKEPVEELAKEQKQVTLEVPKPKPSPQKDRPNKPLISLKDFASKDSEEKTEEDKRHSRSDASLLSLVTAPKSDAFWVNDGPILYNLRDLYHALHDMSDKQYAHHVNRKRNDITGWVEHVLRDPECAKELDRAKSRIEARQIVAGRLRAYRT